MPYGKIRCMPRRTAAMLRFAVAEVEFLAGSSCDPPTFDLAGWLSDRTDCLQPLWNRTAMTAASGS